MNEPKPEAAPRPTRFRTVEDTARFCADGENRCRLCAFRNTPDCTPDTRKHCFDGVLAWFLRR